MSGLSRNQRVKVTLVKSLIGTKKKHRETVRGLGLRGINSTSELQYTPAVLGMLNKVNYLIRFEVLDAT